VLALGQVLGLELLAPPTACQISQRPLLSWFLCLALFTSSSTRNAITLALVRAAVCLIWYTGL
jgi:hypothetical protein